MITIKNKYLQGYKFIDLFAGLGGFRLALESLGAECVYSDEWNEPVCQVYYKNFGEIPAGDITKIDEKAEQPNSCSAFSSSASHNSVFLSVMRGLHFHWLPASWI